jgi:hypothetical protein
MKTIRLVDMAIERMVEIMVMLQVAGCVLNGISPTSDEVLREYFSGTANADLKDCASMTQEMIESMDLEPLERIDSLILKKLAFMPVLTDDAMDDSKEVEMICSAGSCDDQPHLE